MSSGEVREGDLYVAVVQAKHLLSQADNLPASLASLPDQLARVLKGTEGAEWDSLPKQSAFMREQLIEARTNARMLQRTLERRETEIKALSQKVAAGGGSGGGGGDQQKLVAQLEASLAKAKEENEQLKRELKLKQSQPPSPSSSGGGGGSGGGASSEEVEKLRRELQEAKTTIEQLKLVNEAEMLRNSRGYDEGSEMGDSTPRQSPMVSKDLERLKEKLREVERKLLEAKEEAKGAKHEKELTLRNMDEVQRRCDKKTGMLEAEAKRAISEASDCKQRLATLRRETDSLRPKLATLELLAPKVERLTAQLIEREEKVKELTHLNTELEALAEKERQQRVQLQALGSLAGGVEVSTPGEDEKKKKDEEAKKKKKGPKKAFLLTDSAPPTPNSKPQQDGDDDDEDGLGGCSWLAEVQGLLSRMRETAVYDVSVVAPDPRTPAAPLSRRRSFQAAN